MACESQKSYQGEIERDNFEPPAASPALRNSKPENYQKSYQIIPKMLSEKPEKLSKRANFESESAINPALRT